MVPGVSPGEGFNARGTGIDTLVDMSVNGNASNQNLWTIDGVNNVDVGSNRTLLVYPSIDSIQEFRVERASAPSLARPRERSSISSPKVAAISFTALSLNFSATMRSMPRISFSIREVNLKAS